MKIKAFAALRPGLTVEPYELDITEPKSYELLISITHCSVGRGDVSFLRNDYQIPNLASPLVGGHELVGIIEVVGAEVKEFTIGERVGVGYQAWSCGECSYCGAGEENLCQQQECLVMNRQGGFASHIVVDKRFVFKIPASLDSAVAAPLLCSGLTVYSAIKKARINEEMVVGVIGIGGLGHFAVQILHTLGAEVIAFSGKKSQEVVKRLGAAHVLSYGSKEAKPQTFDRLFVTTYAHIDYDHYLSLLKPDGELWVVGVDVQKTMFSSWLLNDLASRSIRGSYIGSPSEMRELLTLVSQKQIRSVVKVLPVDQLNSALQMVANGSEDFRIVIEMNTS